MNCNSYSLCVDVNLDVNDVHAALAVVWPYFIKSRPIPVAALAAFVA